MSEKIKAATRILKSNPRQVIFVGTFVIGLVFIVLASISISLPDNEIRVSSFSPTGWIDVKTNITVQFTKPMVSKDSLNLPVLDPPLVITPPIRGIARWIDTDLLRFFPDEPLLPATQYTVKVESPKTWISGFKIVNKDIYRFGTPTLLSTLVRSTVAPEPLQRGSVRVDVVLKFNYPVNLADLQKHVTFKGDKSAARPELQYTLTAGEKALPGEVVPEAPELSQPDIFDTIFVFLTEPIPLLKTPQHYILTIDKGLGCRNCGQESQNPMVYDVAVQPAVPLVVENVQAQSLENAGVIAVGLSTEVTTEDAKSYITLEPAVDFTIEDSYQGFILHGPFKPGETYTVNIAKGLPSMQGQTLERDFSSRVTFENYPSSLSFTSRATFLPKAGTGLLEFKAVNLSKITVEVEQIFPNNLVYFLSSGYGSYPSYGPNRQLGRSLFIKERDLEITPNQPLLTTIDVPKIVGDSAKGIFLVSVRDREERWISDSRYAMITDIGISARLSDDYLMVWANSLTDAKPIPRATVSLISRNNQTLVEGKTDIRGIAVFDNIKDKLAGFEPFVIIVQREGDMAYVRLDESLLPLADFDVAGRPYLSSGYEAFPYTDRGVYRPGDT
ncbi:MAG TPA: hypothetical protein VMS71_05945, partial [Candidatus Acidoferrum sp.]|nr:hypothetical protein [Candidatus Acidoferrum sp.]